MSKRLNNRHSNPLVDFEFLIQHGGIDKCYETFLLDCEMLSGNFTSVEKLEYEYYEHDEGGNHKRFKETFKKKLNTVLKKAYDSSVSEISNQLGNINSSQNRKDKILMLLDNIEYLYNHKHHIPTYRQNEIINRWLKRLILFLKNKYKSVNVNHSVYEIIKEVNEVNLVDSYFGFKGNVNEIPKLFKLLIILGLFSDEETTMTDFREVISSPEPQKIKIKLKFNCTLQKASYIISKLSPYFENWRDQSIVDSKSFITLQGKPISYSSIQKERSLFKNKLSNSDLISDIDNSFQEFKISKR